jgi:MFS family permease
MTAFAPFATAWSKRFSPRPVIALGGLFFLLGCCLASISNSLWQFELTQGLLLGIGTCFAYMPAVTVAPTWYGPRRGLAMGLILSGTGVGGLVWAPVQNALIETYGFRMALRIAGVITGGLIILSSVFVDWDETTKTRLANENNRNLPIVQQLFNIPLLDWRIAKSRKFAAQLFGATFQAAAYYTPIFFFSTNAMTLGFSTTESANFIALSNACNALGKIGLGIIADRYGRINTLFITTAISAISSFGFWLPSTISSNLLASKGLFITYTIFFGTFASAYISLFPASLVELFGPANFASVNGFLYMSRGVATLCGTPAAGALIRSSMAAFEPSGYLYMVILVGCFLSTATIGTFWVLLEGKRPSHATST